MDQSQAKSSDNVTTSSAQHLNKSSDYATTSSAHHGTKLCDAVYSFHEPEGTLEAEIVFIHGLQLAKNDFENAYWRAWLARDGTEENCWPMTWLPKKFRNARILSLSYDACAWRTPTTGRNDAYSLGESLVQLMVSRDIGIGQKCCPVVFVCHSLGGLVAKQIVVSGYQQFSKDKRVWNLLGNLKAFFFYATPHGGSELANLVGCIPFLSTSPLAENLKVMNPAVGRLNSEFEQIHKDVGRSAWKFYVVGETHATSYGVFSAMVVEEASARCVGCNFMSVAANHIDVCKPKSETDAGFIHLSNCITAVVEDNIRNRGPDLELPSVSVGKEDRLQEVRKLMAIHSIIGLVGMGGVGKTTLSKHLYKEEERRAFEGCCFLEDVKSRGSEACRRQLFRDICREEWSDEKAVLNIQLEKIQQCIVTRKVLLVVDDAGSEKDMKDLQVHAFKDGLKGSKVIVTTRRRDILYANCGVILDVELLNEKEALELFSFYAFHEVNDEERMQLDDQAKAIIKACGELPLSLEVIGQYLRKYNFLKLQERMDIWKAALRRLQEAKPFDGCKDDEKLWARLRISYDGLALEEQSMFLDFACIICATSTITGQLGARKDWLERISDSPIAVRNLMEQSLIKWNNDKQVLVMHDQLRDMGRAIVRQVDGNRSREWENDRLKFSLRNERRWMDLGRAQNFEKLRLLNLTGCDSRVVDHYALHCSEELRWLCLDDTDVTVSSLRKLGWLTGLRVLEMNDCNELKELPKSINELSLLMELHLSWCSSLKTLSKSISELKNLEELSLKWCRSLVRLPTSIGGLTSLKTLNCKGCGSLSEVPESIGELKNLEELSLTWCWPLVRLPTSIGRLTSLKTLDCEGCRSLNEVPKSIGELKNLEELIFKECESLVRLPTSIGGLLSLKTLDCEGCHSLSEVPESIGELKNLEELILWCRSLVKLPTSIGRLTSLKTLNCEGCHSLSEVPESIGELKNLEKLSLTWCGPLVRLPTSIGGLLSLKTLDCEGCGSLSEVPESIGELKNLEELSLTWCGPLVRLPTSIGGLTSLKTLDCERCRSLSEVPESIGELKNLEELRLTWCGPLVRLPTSIGGLTSLKILDCEGCGSLSEVPESIGELKNLEELNLTWCRSLVRLPTSIGGLTSLKTLDCEGCHSLSEVPESMVNSRILRS